MEGVDTAIIIRVPLQLVIVPLLQAENKAKISPVYFRSSRWGNGVEKMKPSRLLTTIPS